MSRESEQITYPQGIKWTKQRKSVYDVLYAAKEPLNAHQIYHLAMHHLQDEGELVENNYAVSTIYRILTAFEENHIVTKSNRMDSGTFVYELERGEHTHYAVCLICKKHILLPHCPVEHIHMPQTGDEFVITGHKLELYGYCKSCRSVK